MRVGLWLLLVAILVLVAIILMGPKSLEDLECGYSSPELEIDCF